MSIKLLYVEGKIDSQILNALISEGGLRGITVSDKGSKEGLQSRVVHERERTGEEDIYYLRDRDFDYDVVLGVDSPIEIRRGGQIVGWHWCRHELENYLIEPGLLSRVFNESMDEIIETMISSANLIRSYEVARWTLGYSKRRGMLPPHYDLHTRPDIVRSKELCVPIDWSSDDCMEWVMSSAQDVEYAQGHSIGIVRIRV